MIHPALRYLVGTRIRNRVRSWIRKLKTPGGVLGLVLLVLVVLGMAVGTGWGRGTDPGERAAIFVTILGFLLVTGVISGLGQRGLVFSAADLDFLFPAPIARRQLIAYQFVPHYLGAAFMAVIYVFLLGGRFLPHPGLFLLAAFLCQVTTSHLSAAAAEGSMLLADTAFRPVRIASVGFVLVLTLGGMALVIAGLGGWGDVPRLLREATSSDVLRVVLFPALFSKTMHCGPLG